MPAGAGIKAAAPKVRGGNPPRTSDVRVSVWSSQIRRPGSTVFQKGVGKDEQLSHDGCECDLCSLSVGTDLQLIDGTRGINSIFTARQAPENGAIPAPQFPDRLPEGAAYDALLGRVMGNEIIRGKLLSNDGELTLVVLALDPSAIKSDRLLGKFEA
jgi:hypothetical protein